MIDKFGLIALGVSLLTMPSLASEESVLARVTVYWPAEGGTQACSNGARLRPGHCAVDPQKIPYGSKVYFPDGPCVAIDTGPAVINRKAARLTGRNARERSALVIDRFFESKEQALAWELAHPHFMTVRVMSPRSTPRDRPQPIIRPQANPTLVAQAIAAPPPPQTNAPPPPAWLRENDPEVATTLKTAARSLLTVPPSYHRRRFAGNAKEETEVPPPTCTRLPLKRTRLA